MIIITFTVATFVGCIKFFSQAIFSLSYFTVLVSLFAI